MNNKVDSKTCIDIIRIQYTVNRDNNILFLSNVTIIDVQLWCEDQILKKSYSSKLYDCLCNILIYIQC